MWLISIVICTQIASTVVAVAEDVVGWAALVVEWACVAVEVAMVECEDEVAKAVDSCLEVVHAVVAVDEEIISSVIVSTTISIDPTMILAVVHHRKCSVATKSIHSNPDRSTATVTVEDECHIPAVVAAVIQDPSLVQQTVHRRCSTLRLTNRIPIPYRHSSLSKSRVQVCPRRTPPTRANRRIHTRIRMAIIQVYDQVVITRRIEIMKADIAIESLEETAEMITADPRLSTEIDHVRHAIETVTEIVIDIVHRETIIVEVVHVVDEVEDLRVISVAEAVAITTIHANRINHDSVRMLINRHGRIVETEDGVGTTIVLVIWITITDRMNSYHQITIRFIAMGDRTTMDLHRKIGHSKTDFGTGTSTRWDPRPTVDRISIKARQVLVRISIRPTTTTMALTLRILLVAEVDPAVSAIGTTISKTIDR